MSYFPPKCPAMQPYPKFPMVYVHDYSMMSWGSVPYASSNGLIINILVGNREINYIFVDHFSVYVLFCMLQALTFVFVVDFRVVLVGAPLEGAEVSDFLLLTIYASHDIYKKYS